MGQGINSSALRDKNEKNIISLIRSNESMSKADIARATGLTFTAVARIIDDLEVRNLIKKQGKTKKQLGKPATLYAINGGGKFAIAVEFKKKELRIATIDFQGNLAHTQSVDIESECIEDLSNTILEQLLGSISNLPIEQREQLVGIGLATCENDVFNMLTIRNNLQQKLLSHEHLPTNTPQKLPLIITLPGVAIAALEALKNPASAQKNILCIYIGDNIDGCFIFNKKIQNSRPKSKRFLASMRVPIDSLCPSPIAQHKSLGELCSLNSLKAELINKKRSIIEFYNPEKTIAESDRVIKNWIIRATSSLNFAIDACASIHQLDEVIISSAMPNHWHFWFLSQLSNKNIPINSNTAHDDVLNRDSIIVGCASFVLINSLQK